jgi:hypothetical protein
MSANTLYHYYGDIREWNILSKPMMLEMLAQNPALTQDQAYDILEATRPTLNLWKTPAAAITAGKPVGMELWKIHVVGWLGFMVLGTVIGLRRWARKRDLAADAVLAKAKPKTVGA